MFYSLLAAVVALALQAPAAPPQTSTAGARSERTQQLSPEDAKLLDHPREREHAWMAALRDRDFKTLETFLAPEYTLFIADAPRDAVPRPIWLRNSTAYNMTEFSQRDFQLQRIGPAVAVVSFVHTQTARPQPPGRPATDRSGDFYLVDVWRRINGEWKVAARYSSWLSKPAASS